MVPLSSEINRVIMQTDFKSPKVRYSTLGTINGTRRKYFSNSTGTLARMGEFQMVLLLTTSPAFTSNVPSPCK